MGQARELRRFAAITRTRKGPRGTVHQGEELRVSLDAFEADDGRSHEYVSVRLWATVDGELRPTKKGVTIRRQELAPVLLALGEAARQMEGSDHDPTRH